MTFKFDEKVREAAAALYEATLKMDVVDLVERVTGERPTADNEAGMQATALQVERIRTQRYALKIMDDTCSGMLLSDYIRILITQGFDMAWQRSFVRRNLQPVGDDLPEWTDAQYVYANRELGAIVVLDTYTPTRGQQPSVNGARMYFCWRDLDKAAYRRSVNLTGTGRWDSESMPNWRRAHPDAEWPPADAFFAGERDARDGFRYGLTQLRAIGEFLPVWPPHHRIRIGLVTSQDYQDFKHLDSHELNATINNLNADRWNSLPDWVRNIAG